MDRTDQANRSETPADGFLRAMEPLVSAGNPLAAAYSMRMMRARGNEAAEAAVVDDLTQRLSAVVEVVGRFAESIRTATGFTLGQLAEGLAAEHLVPDESDDDDDQVPYDDTPEGCWATSAQDDEEACDLPAVDALGLCESHRTAMIEP